jgi:anti-sigma B factor antagonist
MEIQKNFDGDKLTVALIGRLDAVTAIQFDKDIFKSLEGIKNLTIDLTNLDYIASAGLRILLKLQKKMNTQGDMQIKNVKREVREVLDMTGFSRLLTIEESSSPKKLSFDF